MQKLDYTKNKNGVWRGFELLYVYVRTYACAIVY